MYAHADAETLDTKPDTLERLASVTKTKPGQLVHKQVGVDAEAKNQFFCSYETTYTQRDRD